ADRRESPRNRPVLIGNERLSLKRSCSRSRDLKRDVGSKRQSSTDCSQSSLQSGPSCSPGGRSSQDSSALRRTHQRRRTLTSKEASKVSARTCEGCSTARNPLSQRSARVASPLRYCTTSRSIRSFQERWPRSRGHS